MCPQSLLLQGYPRLFLGSKAAGAHTADHPPTPFRNQECVELHLHSPICLHGVHRDKCTAYNKPIKNYTTIDAHDSVLHSSALFFLLKTWTMLNFCYRLKVLNILINTYMNTYIHTYIYRNIHTYIYIHIYRNIIHSYTQTYIYMHINIHTYIHTHIHTYIYAHKHTYIHKYIHTHIHTYIHT